MNISPDAINKAIKDHYPYSWSNETSEAVLGDLGPEGLALLKEIREFSNTPEHWVYSDNMRAYAEMQELLGEKYPFLSGESVTWIATCAAWGWR